MMSQAARLNEAFPLPPIGRSPARWGSRAYGWLAFGDTRQAPVRQRERNGLADHEVVAAIAVLKRLAICKEANEDYSARCLQLARRIADRRRFDPAEVAKIPAATEAQLAMFSRRDGQFAVI
jgi:hypothetical protein